MSNITDPQKFKSAQRQGWDSVAEGWRKWWKPIEESSQVVSHKLIELVQIRSGNTVLDVGTGIGEPAITVAKRLQPSGKVMAIDISPQMLAIARERAKESGLENFIEFKEADAESFSCPNWAFDAVLSRWGLMFLPDLPGALRTMREVLVPGGRIAAAVWSSPPKVPMLNLVIGTVMNEIGVPLPPPGTPGPFSLADENILRDRFGRAGFQDVKVEKGIMNLKVSSPEEFISFHKAINAPIKTMMAGQPAARQDEIWNAVKDAATKHADPATGRITLSNEVIYVSGKR